MKKLIFIYLAGLFFMSDTLFSQESSCSLITGGQCFQAVGISDTYIETSCKKFQEVLFQKRRCPTEKIVGKCIVVSTNKTLEFLFYSPNWTESKMRERCKAMSGNFSM